MVKHICVECGGEYIGHKRKYCSDECKKEARRTYNRERWRNDNPDWDKEVNKVCELCGQPYTVPSRNAHIARFCGAKCNDTWHHREKGMLPWEEWVAIRNKQAQETQVRLEEEREYKLSNLKCIECGSNFKGTLLNQELCSPECRRVRKNRQQRLSKDKRINHTNNVDKDISHETLSERDKGVCYICGGKCDINDHYEVNGYFTVGPNYPSVDHIVPLARGGMHAWDNVKLAHHHCNSMKSDILPNELGLDIDIDDAYAMARKVSPLKKEVKQITKEGKIINIYESTAEAERQTGVKSKGIQNCARGEVKLYRGFKWEYL